MSSFKQIRKNIKYTLLVAVIRVLLVVIQVLPRKVAMSMGAGLGVADAWGARLVCLSQRN